MPALRNIREQDVYGRLMVFADFTAPDGRQGSVHVPVEEYRAHGEIVLEQQADACCVQSRAHGYREPGVDRYEELR